jgi:hypothetical protein
MFINAAPAWQKKKKRENKLEKKKGQVPFFQNKGTIVGQHKNKQ